jgi:hypothetical protein
MDTKACPNQDVVYGLGIIDFTKEPVVVQVPDFKDRFWVFCHKLWVKILS